MKNIYVFLIGISMPLFSFAQNGSDTITTEISLPIILPTLPEVLVNGYELHTPLLNSPAAIGVVDNEDLKRYNNTSILPAINASIPGVRMEERSPSSFRFGIRGSAAQAPFGVRNIKVYYNDIPFTDAGGNTYLNNLGFYNINRLEVIKGPASSLYGAGTGGAVLINSLSPEPEHKAVVHYTAGSYGLHNMAGEFYFGDNHSKHAIRYQHMEAEGYREQSASRKDVFSWDAAMKTSSRNEISVHVLYSNLYYQTPGGLTLAQFNNNPRDARPGTVTIPGAAEQKAAIYQQYFLAGITNTFQVSDHWQNRTTLFASYNQLNNPNIRNYSRSAQPNVGGRTTFSYDKSMGESHLQWITGAEALQQFVTERTYQNNLGDPDTLTDDVEINNLLVFGFTQLTWSYKRWIVTAGASLNTLRIGLSSFHPAYSRQIRQFNNQVAPRFAMLRQFKNNTTLYVSAEKGYTPPSISELAPTGSNINLGLKAAQGWNLSIGCRGYALQQRFYFDINMFMFRLSQSIVQRRDSAGGDYYINAGGTEQNGAEILLRYAAIRSSGGTIKDLNLTTTFSGYHFNYKNFIQLDQDFSGNKLPGVPGHTVSVMLDMDTRFGGYANLTYYYCEPVYLNDANTAQVNDYTLLGARVGYRKALKRMLLDVYAGGDNLLDKRYSLGHDINAVGGRYYNAAPGINFYVGVSLGWNFRNTAEHARLRGD